MPRTLASAWRWSKFGSGSSSKDLIRMFSCSLEILHRLGRRWPPSSPPGEESGAARAVSPEESELWSELGEPGAYPDSSFHSSESASSAFIWGRGSLERQPKRFWQRS